MEKIQKYISAVKPFLSSEKLIEFEKFLTETFKSNEREYEDCVIEVVVDSMKLLTEGETPKQVNEKVWDGGSGHQITSTAAIIAAFHERGAEVRNYFNSLFISDKTQLKEYNDKNLIYNSTVVMGGVNNPVSVG